MKVELSYGTDFTNFLHKSNFIKSAKDYIDFGDYAIGTASKEEENSATTIINVYEPSVLLNEYIFKFNAIFNSITPLSDKLKKCIVDEIYGGSSFVNKYKTTGYQFRNENYTEYLKVLSNIAVDKKNIVDFDKLKKFADIIVETLHNGLFHGNSICIIGLQAYSGNEDNALEISIADAGIGFYDTLVAKIEDCYSVPLEYFAGLENLHSPLSIIKRNYYSIFEAILFRRKVGLRGLYDICIDTVKNSIRSSINIKNKNVRLSLDNHYVIKYISIENDKEKLKDSIQELLQSIKEKNRKSFIPIAEVLKYHLGGVNIYINIKF